MRMFSIARLILAVSLLSCITACAMMGGDEDKGGEVSTAPRKKDSVTMRNNDVLTGRLDLESVRIDTGYLPPLTIKREDIDSIEFFGKSDKVKLRTKAGDILRGRISVDEFRLTESKLPQDPVLKRKDIKYIYFR